MNFIGRQYRFLQKNLYWKAYYGIFGIPFLSSHLVYDVLLSNCHFSKDDIILDYGTGDGLFINQITHDFGPMGVGVDRLPERIEKATKVSNFNHLNNSFVCSSLEEFKPKSKFDKILCLDVLEHLEKPDDHLDKISKLMNERSELIIQTPRDNDRKYVLKNSNVFTYGTDEHKREGFSLKDVSTLLEKNGLKIKFWQSTFAPFSQIAYEVLELIRLKSKVVYSLTWPILYPFCLVDLLLNKKSHSNGLFVVATKKL